MSGNKFLLDTNIILYLLGGKLESSKLPEGNYITSFINELELLSYPQLTKNEEDRIKNFMSNIDVIEFNNSIKTETINLRKKYQLKLPDAIICSTAILYKASLITHDDSLLKVNELKIIKPELKS